MKEMETHIVTGPSEVEPKSTSVHAQIDKINDIRFDQRKGTLCQLPAAGNAVEQTERAAPDRHKPKSRREAVSLSASDTKLLLNLHDRCESVGMKIKKTQLLAAGLHLLSSMPMGKFLAVLGPLESRDSLLRPKKRKAPPRV